MKTPIESSDCHSYSDDSSGPPEPSEAGGDVLEIVQMITTTYANGLKEGVQIRETNDRKVFMEILRICEEHEGEIRLKIAAIIRRYLGLNNS